MTGCDPATGRCRGLIAGSEQALNGLVVNRWAGLLWITVTDSGLDVLLAGAQVVFLRLRFKASFVISCDQSIMSSLDLMPLQITLQQAVVTFCCD